MNGRFVDHVPSAVVGEGSNSMRKDRKWTCVFVRPRRRPHSMRKDTTCRVGVLIMGLPPLPAAEQNPRVKIKRGRVFSFGRGDVHTQCVKIKSGRVFSFGRGDFYVHV